MELLIFWLGAVEKQERVDEKRQVVDERYVERAIGVEINDGHAKKLIEECRHRCGLEQPRQFWLRRNGARRPGRKLRDFLPCFVLCDADVVGALQIKPELRARAEPMPETKGSVAGDATAPMDDLRHAIGRDVDLPRKLGRRDAKLGQLVDQDFSGVDGDLAAGHPGG